MLAGRLMLVSVGWLYILIIQYNAAYAFTLSQPSSAQNATPFAAPANPHETKIPHHPIRPDPTLEINPRSCGAAVLALPDE